MLLELRRRLEMFEQIKEIIAQLMRIEKTSIFLESHLKNDLGFDSLMILELVLELENVFDIEIDDSQIKSFVLVSDVVNIVQLND